MNCGRLTVTIPYMAEEKPPIFQSNHGLLSIDTTVLHSSHRLRNYLMYRENKFEELQDAASSPYVLG
jgi:hypothetical protein